MFSGRSQTQKPTHWTSPLIRNVQNREICRDEKHISGCQGVDVVDNGVEGIWGMAAKGHENALTLIMMMDAQPRIYEKPLNCTLSGG